MPESTLKERQRKLREEHILDVARELLPRVGYEAMSMEELASEAGISKATLYQHFASKEELAVQVIVRMRRHGEERMRSMDPTLPAITRLEQMLRRGLERRVGIWGAGESMLPLNLRRHPEYQAQQERMMVYLHALIEQAKSEGDAVPDLDTSVVAHTFSQLFQMDYSTLAQGGDEERQRLSETLTRLMFEGLRARRPCL